MAFGLGDVPAHLAEPGRDGVDPVLEHLGIFRENVVPIFVRAFSMVVLLKLKLACMSLRSRKSWAFAMMAVLFCFPSATFRCSAYLPNDVGAVRCFASTVLSATTSPWKRGLFLGGMERRSD